ncbi:MAG: tRNA threonylcarbamoyladenosine biosynthesis protein TsaE [Chlamydiae bacterium]|nr:tRNA threonylcarbamoyladenosine biosynthesis protein TsaE [Chlamydiota bacterium]
MLLKTESETEKFGSELALKLKPRDVVALHGDLGAGKTTLVKGIVEMLASVSKREIQSPTFTYLSIYEAQTPIFHFDLYRLKDHNAFIQMGFLDYLNEEGICLIEWPDRIASLLPEHTLHIKLVHFEGSRRKIDVYKT